MKQGQRRSTGESGRIDPAKVIAEFLEDMTVAARKTYPAWSRVLVDGIVDAAPEGSELYRQLIDYQPLEDFYFGGVVALEAAKIRVYTEPSMAGDLLIELANQVDRMSGRPDRVVADLVFSMISRIGVESGANILTMPYDKVVELLLYRIGVPHYDATRPLMSDFAFRHSLGEPLARGIPGWWKAKAAKLKRQADAASQFGHIRLAAE